MQPGRKGRTALELAELSEGKQESLLHYIFAVLWIAQELSCGPLKAGNAGCKKGFQFTGIHVDWKNRRF